MDKYQIGVRSVLFSLYKNQIVITSKNWYWSAKFI